MPISVRNLVFIISSFIQLFFVQETAVGSIQELPQALSLRGVLAIHQGQCFSNCDGLDLEQIFLKDRKAC